jgi:type IV pilus assembly protein PilC
MVATGEYSGHLEQVLRNLELYYDEEDRMFAKLRSALDYPALLLMIMAVILLLTVLYILPLFARVYQSMAGSLATQSAISVDASAVIGWVSLVITALCAAGAYYLSLSAHSEKGRGRVIRQLERIPLTSKAMYRLALSRFTAALATFVSSGVTSEEAMGQALVTVQHDKLRSRIQAAHDSMVDLDHPLSLPQAIGKHEVFEPLYARMLNVGMRSGTADETLAQMSQTFFDDAIVQIDRSLDHVEPVLAAFLTVAVGATLIAVMLPLVGVMIAIG